MNWSEALRRPCPRCGAAAAVRCQGAHGERQAHHRERYGGQPIERPRRSRATRCNTEGWVYFIGPVSANCVKIGWSAADPERRLAELQTGNGEQLHVYGAMRGTQRTEQALHEAWKHLHKRGEWFELSSALFDFIHEVSAK